MPQGLSTARQRELTNVRRSRRLIPQGSDRGSDELDDMADLGDIGAN